MNKWLSLNYAPVRGLFDRIQRRILRAQRKVLRGIFLEKGLADLVLRARALRDNSKTHGNRKVINFQRIYDTYCAIVTKATSQVEPGAVGVSGA